MNDSLASVYAERQHTLARSFAKDCVLMVGSGEEPMASMNYPAAFRVNSQFFYLTGGRDPGSVLILRDHGGMTTRTLILHTQTPLEKRWHSPRHWDLSHPDLADYDEVYEWHDVQALRGLFNKLAKDKICLINGDLSRYREYFSVALLDNQKLGEAITRMRVVKDKHEQNIMKESIHLSALVHARLAAKRHIRPAHERRWQADWLAFGAAKGLYQQGYMPIIAGGERACCLHYQANNQSMKKESYVLVDAGFEHQGYTADITRMYFFNKVKRGDLKGIYESLLALQSRLIANAVVGTTLADLQEQAKVLLAQMIHDHHWENGSVEKILTEDVIKYYPHRIGHHLGIDVHDLVSDASLYQRPLEAGMMITIEPGLYIDPALFAKDHPALGIGFRIEDDLLITSEGPVVLSAAAPKTWDKIGADS